MTEEEQIQKGFNHGYQLQKHQPELAKTLQEGFQDKKAPYALGFIAGSQEYVLETEKTKGSKLSNYLNKSEAQQQGDSQERDNQSDLDLER